MSAAANLPKPVPAVAWDFHPGQELRVRLEPWLALNKNLSKGLKPLDIPRVTVMRVYQNAVVLKGQTKEDSFPRVGFSVMEMYKQGIIYQKPVSIDERAATDKKAFPAGRAYVLGSEIIVQFPYNKKLVEQVKHVRGEKRYERSDKTWRWDANPINALFVLQGLKDTRIDLSEPQLHELASSAEAAMREMQKRIDAAQVIKRADASTLAQPEGLKTKLWPHQLIAVHYAAQFRGSGFFLGLGAGKSLSAIALSLQIKAMRILIICPKQVLPVWKLEFEKHYANPVHVVMLDAEMGTVAKRVEHAKKEMTYAEKLGIPCVVVVTPASAVRPPFGPKFSVDQKGNSTGQIAKKSMGWALSQEPDGARFDMVVVDEAQCLANYRTSISRMCWRFGQNDKVFRLPLSGTPAPNDVLQFYGIMRFINPKVFPGSYQEFQSEYAITDQYDRVIEYKNVEELHKLVFQQAFRVETKDVLKLPPQTFTARYYDLPSEEAKIYRDMKKNMVAYLQNGSEMLTAPNVLTRLLRLSQIVSGIVEDGVSGKTHVIGNTRLELLMSVIQDEIPAGEPFVVFARFRADVQRIKDSLNAIGLKCGEVSGRTKKKKGQDEDWVEFQRGQFDAIVVQLRSGGAGIDLTRAAYVIYYAKDYGYGNYEQTLARVHRPGQTRNTTYISLIASGTVDEDIEDVLERKGNLLTEFMRQRNVEIDSTSVVEDDSVDTDELELVEARIVDSDISASEVIG